jgi:hypothetical protein
MILRPAATASTQAAGRFFKGNPMKPLQTRIATKNQQLTEHLHGYDERFDADLDDGDDGVTIPELNPRPFRPGEETDY